MRQLMQFAVILGVSLAGEALNALIPLPIPASVYGLCLMLLLLSTGVIKVEKVRGAAFLMIELMPVMFIAPTVGLMDVFADLIPVLAPFVLIALVGTVVVMGVTGRATQGVMRRERGQRDA